MIIFLLFFISIFSQMPKDAKIYIAGHKGLVGSAICRCLEKNGYNNILLKTHQEKMVAVTWIIYMQHLKQ